MSELNHHLVKRVPLVNHCVCQIHCGEHHWRTTARGHVFLLRACRQRGQVHLPGNRTSLHSHCLVAGGEVGLILGLDLPEPKKTGRMQKNNLQPHYKSLSLSSLFFFGCLCRLVTLDQPLQQPPGVDWATALEDNTCQ